MQDFSKILVPLMKLMWKGEKYKWTKECHSAFEEVKHKFTIAPSLAVPNDSHSMRIYGNVSSKGLGCVHIKNGWVIEHTPW